MVNNEAFNDNVPQRVQQTLNDATYLADGSDNAAARLQNDVYQNYQQLQGGPGYTAYLDQVTASLSHNASFPEVAASWTNHNTRLFDMNGDGKLDQGEISGAIGRSADPLERQILISVRDQFQTIKHSGGDGFLGIRPNALEHNDFNQYAGDNQAQRNQVAALALQQSHSRYLMQPLLSTDDGNPDRSLFRVLDNVTGGAKDGDVSKHDLKSFVDQYDRAAFNGGDVNQGVWTRANRDYAANLAKNWNTPEVQALRGRYSDENENGQNEGVNEYITERGLLAASGYGGGTNLYQTFETPRPQPQALAPAPQEVAPREVAPREVTPLKQEQCGPSPEQIAQARTAFHRQLKQHINQEAHYTVKPGQGFDVIARDVIKTHSHDDSYKNPQTVVAFSDHIARMNGRDGRLSKSPVLQPGENLKVFDDSWVQSQIQQRMRLFNQSIARAQAVPCTDTPPSDDPGY